VALIVIVAAGLVFLFCGRKKSAGNKAPVVVGDGQGAHMVQVAQPPPPVYGGQQGFYGEQQQAGFKGVETQVKDIPSEVR